MLCALTKECAAICVDTDSEKEEVPLKMTAVKKPPPTPPASLRPPAMQTEAEMWKAKYEELKLLLEQKKKEEVAATPASPPTAKALFSPTTTPNGEGTVAVQDAQPEVSEEEMKRLAALDLSREELSSHALYMRLRRLCTPTGTGKLQVSQEVADQWSQGNRDELQLALVMALKQHGYDDSAAVRKLVRVGQGLLRKFFFL